MKMIQAYIKPHRVSETSLALHRLDAVTGISTFVVHGWGRKKLRVEETRHEARVSDFEEYVKIETVCEDAAVSEVVETLRHAARTGLPGDGRVYVIPVEDSRPVREDE